MSGKTQRAQKQVHKKYSQLMVNEKAKAVQSEKNFQKMGGIKLEKNEKS